MIRGALRAALVVTACLAHPVLPGGSAMSQDVGVGAGAVFESYAFDDADATGFETLTLLTVPFGAEWQPASGLALSLTGAWARGELTLADESTLSVSGPTDTSLRASWTLGRDFVTLSGAVLLPSGKVDHTAEEARVAGAIAYDLLPFQISNWGTGGGADASIAVAVPLEGASVGFRVGYRVVAEYEPFEGDPVTGSETFVYDPGDQLYVRGAFDTDIGRSSKLSASVTWQTFGDDTSEGTNLFRTGDRIQGLASLAFPLAGGASGWTYAGVLHRQEGSFLELQLGDEPPSQNIFFAGGGARLLVGGVTVLPVVDVRALRTDDGLGQGFLAGFGGSLEIPLGAGPVLVPRGRFRVGEVLVSDEVESAVTGFEVGLGVRGIGR